MCWDAPGTTRRLSPVILFSLVLSGAQSACTARWLLVVAVCVVVVGVAWRLSRLILPFVHDVGPPGGPACGRCLELRVRRALGFGCSFPWGRPCHWSGVRSYPPPSSSASLPLSSHPLALALRADIENEKPLTPHRTTRREMRYNRPRFCRPAAEGRHRHYLKHSVGGVLAVFSHCLSRDANQGSSGRL